MPGDDELRQVVRSVLGDLHARNARVLPPSPEWALLPAPQSEPETSTDANSCLGSALLVGAAGTGCLGSVPLFVLAVGVGLALLLAGGRAGRRAPGRPPQRPHVRPGPMATELRVSPEGLELRYGRDWLWFDWSAVLDMRPLSDHSAGTVGRDWVVTVDQQHIVLADDTHSRSSVCRTIQAVHHHLQARRRRMEAVPPRALSPAEDGAAEDRGLSRSDE